MQWYDDPRVTIAFQYTVREDDKFPTGLVSTDLTTDRPALKEWTAWGGRRAPTDPPPPSTCGEAQEPACASSQSASDVKPTITPSIQYCERTASLRVAVERQRAVVRERERADVADDDDRDLHVPGVLLGKTE